MDAYDYWLARTEHRCGRFEGDGWFNSRDDFRDAFRLPWISSALDCAPPRWPPMTWKIFIDICLQYSTVNGLRLRLLPRSPASQAPSLPSLSRAPTHRRDGPLLLKRCAHVVLHHYSAALYYRWCMDGVFTCPAPIATIPTTAAYRTPHLPNLAPRSSAGPVLSNIPQPTLR